MQIYLHGCNNNPLPRPLKNTLGLTYNRPYHATQDTVVDLLMFYRLPAPRARYTARRTVRISSAPLAHHAVYAHINTRCYPGVQKQNSHC